MIIKCKEVKLLRAAGMPGRGTERWTRLEPGGRRRKRKRKRKRRRRRRRRRSTGGEEESVRKGTGSIFHHCSSSRQP